MKIASVRLARIFAFIQLEDLNPYGRYIYADLVKALIERYDFKKYPQSIDQYNYQTGVNFEFGKWNDIEISKLTFLLGGIGVDTRSSTEDSEKILLEILNLGVSVLKLPSDPNMIKRKAFVSELFFISEVPLDTLNPKLKELADQVSNAVSSSVGLPLAYQATGIAFDFDQLQTKIPIAQLRIERQADVPFSENRYYSVAPLRTKEHIKFLTDFESALCSFG